jgi:hypothetical protein
VEELLAADPEGRARAIRVRQLTAETGRQWQQEATLVCRVPELRGIDAQLLVASGITEPAELAAAEAASLLEQITTVAASELGQRLLREQPPPGLEAVAGWIERAGQSRVLQAA